MTKLNISNTDLIVLHATKKRVGQSIENVIKKKNFILHKSERNCLNGIIQCFAEFLLSTKVSLSSFQSLI